MHPQGNGDIEAMEYDGMEAFPSSQPLPAQNRYPYCICWSPLCPLTIIMPFIGHMGIADSTGMTWDFAGPYHINREHMVFGRPTIYLQLDPKKCQRKSWDDGVRAANIVFGGGELDGKHYHGRSHNICCQNCHSHVAYALNEMRYLGFGGWNMFFLAFWVVLRGQYVGFGSVLKTWGPFVAIIALIMIVHFVFDAGNSG